jgi:hypothetical protein
MLVGLARFGRGHVQLLGRPIVRLQRVRCLARSSALNEASQATLDVGAGEQDAMGAAAAAQADIGAQADDLPLVGAAGVWLAELKQVTDRELEQLAGPI